MLLGRVGGQVGVLVQVVSRCNDRGTRRIDLCTTILR